MDNNAVTTTRRNEYLRRAEEAQREAHKNRDPQLRLSWNRIAEDYRALAKTVPY